MSRSGRQSIGANPEQLELERQLANVQQLDSSSKQVCAQCKAVCQSLRKCPPAEWEFVQGLMQHADAFPDLQGRLDRWQNQVRSKQLVYDQLADHVTNFVSKPMSQLQKVRPAVEKVAKKREKKLAEEAQLEAQLAKEEGKGRSGKRLAQVAYLRKDLQSARSQLADINGYLVDDLRSLQSARAEYARPCLRALVHAEAQHFGRLAELSARISEIFSADEDLICLSADSYHELTREKLKEIKALSIVADPDQ